MIASPKSKAAIYADNVWTDFPAMHSFQGPPLVLIVFFGSKSPVVGFEDKRFRPVGVAVVAGSLVLVVPIL